MTEGNAAQAVEESGTESRTWPRAWYADRGTWAKLALELFVVFFGVSAAFALNEYRADREGRNPDHGLSRTGQRA